MALRTPLHYFLESGDWNRKFFVNFVSAARLMVQQMHRAEYVSLMISTVMLQDVLDHLPSSAPLLTSLQITTPMPREQDTTSIERSILGRLEMPSLKSLDLWAHPVDWARYTFPKGLTRLAITYSKDFQAHFCFPSISYIIAAISVLPLEHLALYDALPEYGAPPREDIKQIAMARLAHIEIGTGFLFSATYFLNHISLPSNNKTVIRLRHGYSLETVTLLSAFVKAKFTRPITSLGVTCEGVTFKHDVAGSPEDPHNTLSPEISFQGMFSSHVDPDTIQIELLDHIPLQAVTTLTLGQYRPFMPPFHRGDTWVRLFKTMPNVTSLRVIGQGHDNFLHGSINHLLGPIATTDGDESHLVFPKLKTIFFGREQRLIFGMGPVMYRVPRETTTVYVKAFCEALRHRIVKECAVERVLLDRNVSDHLTEEELGLMKEVVLVE